MRRVTSSDGTRIAYSTVGDGPEVVVVLGAMATRTSGTRLARILAADFTVSTYDRRGRGSSTDVAPYAPEREVEDLHAVIEDRGGVAHLYGHSSGAAIALKAAALVDGRVERAAIYEPPFMTTRERMGAARQYSQGLGSALADHDADRAVSLFLTHVGVSDKQIAAMSRLPMWRGLTALAPTLAYDDAVLGDGQTVPYETAARITTPVMAMYGGKSPEFMQAAVTAVTSVIATAHTVVIPGEDHGVTPKAIAPVLTTFFQTGNMS